MKNRKGGGGGGGGRTPDWAMRMQYFSPSKIPTRIRLVPQNPEQLWFKYTGKWIKVTDPKTGQQVSRFIVGNSHNGTREVPDLLYYYAIENQKPELMASESDAITVVVLEEFHEVEKGRTKNDKPYYDYVRCMGKNRFGQSVCEHCNKGVSKVFGQKKHWSMWPSARKLFEQQLAELADRCVACNKGMVSVYGYTCPNCGGELANHYTRAIDPEIEQSLRYEEVECHHCGKIGLANQLVECVVRHGEGDEVVFSEGCGNPKRPEPVENVWDYDITVVEETVGKSSRTVITGFTPRQEYPQLDKEKERPYDFIFFERMTIEEQSKLMGRPIPREWGDEKSIQQMMDQYFADLRGSAAVAPDEGDSDSKPWTK